MAFAWTFTTQPTHEDMRLLRDGLYGKGPFARWKNEYPTDLTVARVAGNGPANEPQPAGWETSSAACGQRARTPFVLKLNDEDLRGSFRQIFEQVFGLDKGGLKAVETSSTRSTMSSSARSSRLSSWAIRPRAIRIHAST